MTPPIRLILCVVFFHSLTIILNYIHPGWSKELSREINRLVSSERECEALTARLEAIHNCREGKTEVVHELRAGRLTLREAAALFHWLNTQQLDEGGWEQFRRKYPGNSDEARHCLEVIFFAQSLLADRVPTEAAALAQRLQVELDELPEDASLPVRGEE